MDFTYLDSLLSFYEIPFWVIDRGQEQVVFSKHSSPLVDFNLLKSCRQAFNQNLLPFIYVLESNLGYLYWSNGAYDFVGGPLLLTDYSGLFQHQLPDLLDIKQMSVAECRQCLTIISYFCNQSLYLLSDIEVLWAHNEEYYHVRNQEIDFYRFEKSENERRHDSISYETTYLKLIEEGDEKRLLDFFDNQSLDEKNIGKIAETSFKQMEYMAVSSITLACRAAIKGGLNPELSHDLSDLYLQKIAKCKSEKELIVMTGKAQFDFCKAVGSHKDSRSDNIFVEQCKDYITNHLYQICKVGDISKKLNISRPYLSTLFKISEGITIQEYIMKMRCEHAAEMLSYSDEPLSVIAEYLCFSSQSHFGVQFKKFYGMTPRQYRQKNKYIKTNI
ncbi:AraC family transcriptional regulator [Streptococcus moroccensis]|uniref:AraC-like DNA-binding protein n=1 Tax=Streptococcus moroccensis TaxID=1451356 RepID=A0ABT9YPB2_9STRE|nr:AraC family transcriptional regulator [Streptococcus moroccensis]MDQ0221832.1 AraC-like DNA-binding protein [Streptococcus moroccensis]